VAVGLLVGYLAYRGGRKGGEGYRGGLSGRFYWEKGILSIRFILVGYKGNPVIDSIVAKVRVSLHSHVLRGSQLARLGQLLGCQGYLACVYSEVIPNVPLVTYLPIFPCDLPTNIRKL